MEDFHNWLNQKLQGLNTDESVFGTYILGILDSDETSEEKTEALQGILSEIVENVNEILPHCNEILEKWQTCKPKEIGVHEMSNEEVEDKLAKLMESQTLTITKQKQYTAEEKKIREAILSQYGHMSDDQGDNDEGEEGGKGNGDNGLERNLNAHTVAQAEKIKREQAKIDSQKKKEKDKEDREKQKQLKEEKKEKRKTVKGERRR